MEKVLLPAAEPQGTLHSGGPIRRLLLALLLTLPPVAAASAAQVDPQILIWSQQLAPGVRSLHWQQPAGPHSFYAVQVDLSEPRITGAVRHGAEPTLRLLPVSQLATSSAEGRQPVAAINGDFFLFPSARQPGLPTGAALVDGELVRTPFPRSALVRRSSGLYEIVVLQNATTLTMPDGAAVPIADVNYPRAPDRIVLYTPRYGATTRTPAVGTEVYLQPESFPLRLNQRTRALVRATPVGQGDAVLNPGMWVLSGAGTASGTLKRLRPGDSVEIATAFTPALQEGDLVIGGGPRLLRNGRTLVEAEGGSVNGAFSITRHPRSAVGFNSKNLWLVAVDGRRPGHSSGASLQELGQAMARLGCTEAMNLDGGGSTTLWARGQVLNRPSDGRERAVANALVIEYRGEIGEAARLRIDPPAADLLPGARIQPRITPVDAEGNNVGGEPAAVQWTGVSVRAEEGALTALDLPDRDSPGIAAEQVVAEASGLRGEIEIRTHPRPARLELFPANTRLAPGAGLTYALRASGADGRALVTGRVNWSVSGPLTLVSDGVVQAGPGQGSAVVRAEAGGVTGEATVEVGEGIAARLKNLLKPAVKAIQSLKK